MSNDLKNKAILQGEVVSNYKNMYTIRLIDDCGITNYPRVTVKRPREEVKRFARVRVICDIHGNRLLCEELLPAELSIPNGRRMVYENKVTLSGTLSELKKINGGVIGSIKAGTKTIRICAYYSTAKLLSGLVGKEIIAFAKLSTKIKHNRKFQDIVILDAAEA